MREDAGSCFYEKGPPSVLDLGFQASRVFFLEQRTGKLCAVACVRPGKLLPQRSGLWSGFIPPHSKCVCAAVNGKGGASWRGDASPGVQEAAVQGLWLQPPGGQISDPSSLPESWIGPCRDFQYFQTRVIQKGMIINIPYTSKLTKHFYRHSH